MSIPVRYGHVVAGKPRVKVSNIEKVRYILIDNSFSTYNNLNFRLGCPLDVDLSWHSEHPALHPNERKEL